MANKTCSQWKLKRAQSGNDANYALDSAVGATGVYACLIDTASFTPNPTTDAFYSTIAPYIVGTPQEILSKTLTATAGGANFDGADVTFPSVTGASAEVIAIYRQNAGANTTWPIIAYVDTGVTGLPVTPNGGNISITWNASGILEL
jgi:hypothetical protein